MINRLLPNRYTFFWVLFHLALGIACIFTPFALIAWFYAVLFNSLPRLTKGKLVFRWVNIAYLITYLSAFELLARMAKTSPIIPYELSKYLMFALLLLGIVLGSAKGSRGFWLLLLLLPAVAVDESGLVDNYQYYVFNLLGPVNVALAVIFFSRLPLSEEQLTGLLRLLIFPLLSVLAFTYINTPNYDEIEFSLGANFTTAGGFGSNQVSTALGLGMFLSFLFWLNRWKLTGYRYADAILMFAFAFQGLLTFSRGGMIGGVLAMLVVLFVLTRTRAKLKKQFRLPAVHKYVLPAVFLSVGAFFVADNITGGLLTLRYQGETQGTLLGYKEKNLNTLTTGRYDIFLGDLALWSEHPVLGTGVAASGILREKATGVAAHVEMSRLLAEHGVLGLIYFIMLCSLFFLIWRRNTNPLVKSILMGLFLLGLYTTFHAAIRTFVTPLLIGLSLVSVLIPDDYKKQEPGGNLPSPT